MRYGAALALGRLKHQHDVRIPPARHIRIDGPVGGGAQGDGDIIAALPVEIVAGDKPIELIVPSLASEKRLRFGDRLGQAYAA